jgi:hypothetical protein
MQLLVGFVEHTVCAVLRYTMIYSSAVVLDPTSLSLYAVISGLCCAYCVCSLAIYSSVVVLQPYIHAVISGQRYLKW